MDLGTYPEDALAVVGAYLARGSLDHRLDGASSFRRLDGRQVSVLLVERSDNEASTRSYALRTVRQEFTRMAAFLFADVITPGEALRAEADERFRFGQRSLQVKNEFGYLLGGIGRPILVPRHVTWHPDSPVPLALALLERTWPSIPALDDSSAGDVLAKLETDPLYLVGRLQQAMTILLADDLPPMDPQTTLLSQALDDALDWRLHTGRPCDQCEQCRDTLCDQCTADWEQADRYHELARALGVMGDEPATTPPAEPGHPAADPGQITA